MCGCAFNESSALKKASFDPDFFYGEEDIDLSYRLKKAANNLCRS